MRVGVKRRRTKTQINEEKEEAALREQAVNTSLLENQQMKQRLAHMEQEGSNNQNAAKILSELMQKGLVKQYESGNIQVPSESKQRPKDN